MRDNEGRRLSDSCAACLLALTACLAIGCGDGPERATPGAIASAWRDPAKRTATAETIEKTKAFNGLTLTQVSALIGRPSRKLDSISDAMTPFAGGYAWSRPNCQGTPSDCLLLSIEIESGRVIDTTVPDHDS